MGMRKYGNIVVIVKRPSGTLEAAAPELQHFDIVFH